MAAAEAVGDWGERERKGGGDEADILGQILGRVVNLSRAHETTCRINLRSGLGRAAITFHV
jgi:hypothetical protein